MLREIADHDTDDEYWEVINQWPMHEKIRVPAMHTAGWFDHVSMGQFEAYERIRDFGAAETARNGQRLFVGPWYHIITQTGDAHRRFGTWDFGEQADVSVRDYHRRFLDLHLKDIDDGISEEPPVRVFLMGENRWVDLAPNPDSPCIWLKGIKNLELPIRHGEGKFIPRNDALLAELQKNGQIPLRYALPDGSPANDLTNLSLTADGGITQGAGKWISIEHHPYERALARSDGEAH